jgi:tetratricopeptide (TPR) repeat protein
MASALARRLHAASVDVQDLRRAEDLAAEASRLDPAFAPAAMRLVSLLRARGDFRGAAEAAGAALAAQPRGSEAAALLRDQAVISWIAAGDTGRAEAVAGVEDAAYRDRAATRILVGFTHLKAGRIADAERVFAESANRGSEPLAAIGLVQCALSRSDVAAAMTALAAWERTHPKDRDVRLTATQLLLQAGHVAEAHTVARASRDANPGDAVAVAEFARVLARQGRLADAVAEADRFDDGGTAAGRAEARLLTGMVRLTCAGDGAAALAIAHEVATTPAVAAGHAREARVLEAEALLQLERDDEARAVAATIVAAWPGDVPATAVDRVLERRVRFVLGTLAARAERYPVAAEAFERCLAIDSTDFAAANNLAWVLAQGAGTCERALKLARWLTETQPFEANYWDTRAQCAAKAHDADDATSSWRKALEIHGPAWSGAKVESAIRYAEFLGAAGHRDEASDLARAVLETKPGPALDARARRLTGE